MIAHPGGQELVVTVQNLQARWRWPGAPEQGGGAQLNALDQYLPPLLLIFPRARVGELVARLFHAVIIVRPEEVGPIRARRLLDQFVVHKVKW